jgi:hypothetical protein
MRDCSALIALVLFFLTSCSDDGGWTQEQRLNAQNVLVALNEKIEATRLSNDLSPPGVPAVVSRRNYEPIFGKMRAAHAHATVVQDDVLDKIHPELRRHWREEFIEGLRLRISNWEKADMRAEIEGSALLDKFGDWYTKNNNNIRIPKK